MIERWITKKLKQSLNEASSVCLLGARQVGMYNVNYYYRDTPIIITGFWVKKTGL